jgi:hypothetical protein
MGRGPQANLYPHNTYHGPSPHYRTPLNPADFKPLRFTDSPQNYFGLKTSPGPSDSSGQPMTSSTSMTPSSLARNNSSSGLRPSSNCSSDDEVRYLNWSLTCLTYLTFLSYKFFLTYNYYLSSKSFFSLQVYFILQAFPILHTSLFLSCWSFLSSKSFLYYKSFLSYKFFFLTSLLSLSYNSFLYREIRLMCSLWDRDKVITLNKLYNLLLVQSN